MNKKINEIKHLKPLSRYMCRRCGYVSAGELERLSDAIKISVPSSILSSRIQALKGVETHANTIKKLQDKLEWRCDDDNEHLIRVRSINRITMSVKDARDLFGAFDGMPRTAFMLKKR